MPKPYPAEFRRHAVALVRAGKPVSYFAVELGISQGGLHNCVRQDQIDLDEIASVSSSESVELKPARKWIRELEMEPEIVKPAAKLFEEDAPHPKGSTQ